MNFPDAETARTICIWLMDLSLALLAGSAILNVKAKHPRLRKLAIAGLLLLAVVTPAYLLATAASFTEQPLPDAISQIPLVLTHSQTGRLVWPLAAGWLLMSMALFGHISRTATVVVALSGFVLAAWARAASGHAGDNGLFMAAVMIHTVHIVAACSWAGLLAAYLTLGNKAASANHGEVIRYLSEMALLCLLTVMFTGLADVLRIVEAAGKTSFLTSGYAADLGVKLLLAAGAAGLGGLNRFLVMPGIGESPKLQHRFMVIALLETVVLGLVMLLGVQLGSSMPGE